MLIRFIQVRFFVFELQDKEPLLRIAPSWIKISFRLGRNGEEDKREEPIPLIKSIYSWKMLPNITHLIFLVDHVNYIQTKQRINTKT